MGSWMWTRLAEARGSRNSLAGWRKLLEEGFEAVRPYLTACPGVRVPAYPCPVTGLWLTVRESLGGGYVAFATGDDADAAEDVRLEWADVQGWALDARALGEGVREALGLEAGRDTGNSKLDTGGNAGTPKGMEIGVCRRDGRRRRVVMCLAEDAAGAVAAARDAAAAGAGCVLVAGRHPGVRELLEAHGVAEVPMEECLRVEGGRIAGDCGRACEAVGGDMKVRELKQHLDVRMDTIGRKYADLEAENEGLKRDLATVLANLAMKVEPEFFQWVFVILGAGSVSAAARTLGIPNATFDARLKRYVDRGGVYRTLYGMVGVRAKGVGRKSVAGFNELFAAHQASGDAGEADTLRQLLNALEEMDKANWEAMRDELIEMVKSAIR